MENYKELVAKLPAPQTKEEQYIYALTCSAAGVQNNQKFSNSPFWRLEQYWRAFYLINDDNFKKNNLVIDGLKTDVLSNSDNIKENQNKININIAEIERNRQEIARLDEVKTDVGHKHSVNDIIGLKNGTTVKWDNILNKPSEFPPSEHNHDDLYYSENEVDVKLYEKQMAINNKQDAMTEVTNEEILAIFNS